MKINCRWPNSRPGSLRSALLAGVALASFAAASPLHAQHRVILFGVDGLSTEGVADAKDPNIHALMQSGAWTMHMRSVRPTVSAPNWASMIMGAPVELDSVTSNSWKASAPPYPPACEGAPGIFPTVLGLEHQQHPQAKIGFFTDWGTYAHLFEPGAATQVVDHGTHDEVFNEALAYLASDKPQVLIIHMDEVDDNGHAHGWGSPQYLAAVANVDARLGRLMALLDKLGLRKSTDVILVSDHGGIRRGHGGDTPQEIFTPWIISGPGIRKNYEIKNRALMDYDLAATMARILHVKPSPCWRSKPIHEAFQ